MKKFFGLALLSAITASQALADCRSNLTPEDFLVFARGKIEAKQADFQGVVGAIASISTENFQFNIHYALVNPSIVCTNVVAGGDIILNQSSVDGGNVESSSNISVQDSHVRGQSIAGQNAWISSDNDGVVEHKVTVNVLNLPDAAKFFSNKSESLARQSGAAPQHVGSALLMKQSDNSSVQVFSMSSEELSKSSSVNFYGDANSIFLVNITGSEASIQNKPIRISPSMNPGQVILNFPEAHTLTISNTRDPRGVLSLLGLDDGDFGGIPATILAPNADLNFTYGQIDGGVFVRNLTEQGITGPSSGGHGQINHFPTPWDSI